MNTEVSAQNLTLPLPSAPKLSAGKAEDVSVAAAGSLPPWALAEPPAGILSTGEGLALFLKG